MALGELERQVALLEASRDDFRSAFAVLGRKIDDMQTILSTLDGGLKATLVAIQRRQDNNSERLREVEQVVTVLRHTPAKTQCAVDATPQGGEVSLEASWVRSKPLRSTILGAVVAGLLVLALAACGRYVIDASVDRTVKVLQERVLKGAL